MSEKTKDFISEVYKKEGINDRYATTLATLTKAKAKLKTTAAVKDVVLLVTKRGFENIASHVGTVTAVTEENYTFDMNVNGAKKSFTLPFNFLAKSGMVTVGFYTIK